MPSSPMWASGPNPNDRGYWAILDGPLPSAVTSWVLRTVGVGFASRSHAASTLGG
jgi:hypothetical protein